MDVQISRRLTLKDIFLLVKSDLAEVETRLDSEIQSAIPLVNDINRYLHTSGGKRLRPAVLLLASKLCGAPTEAALRLSVVVELIHVATLVHDDIIDNSDVRRGRPSVNAKWGNQITVLMGDWLYMTSFQIAMKERSMRILDILIDITRKMVEGELLQLEQEGRMEVTEQQQLEISLYKTAYLFSGCGRLGAILGNMDPAREEGLALYGRSLGMAFQLVDDQLDYTSAQKDMGKPVLKDLEEGKMTLPIIFMLRRACPAERDFLGQVILEHDFSDANKQEILSLVWKYGALDELKLRSQAYAKQARDAIAVFPDSIYRDALLQVPDFVLNRNN
jgi:octaprenyl-diphosphate synthase